MLEVITLIFWLGIINLLKLVWSDCESLTIDARPSWLMSGVVLACFWLSGRALEMLFIAIVFIFLLSKLKKFAGFVGLSEGDVTVLAWVLPAMWLIGYFYLTIFLIGYVLVLIFIYKVLHKNSGSPATIPITIGFCLVWITITLYPTII